MPTAVNFAQPLQNSRPKPLSADYRVVQCDFCADEAIDFVQTQRGISCHKCVRAFVACTFEQVEKDLEARRIGNMGRKRA